MMNQFMWMHDELVIFASLILLCYATTQNGEVITSSCYERLPYTLAYSY
uniref:Uncharacterized protein n=1 Tax=Setaria viridis TaxID=4556 RepID=A0A4U6VG21_SETVI|nr:hypothetical protein SEVIR_3G333150v2 [Setaria viridis]